MCLYLPAMATTEELQFLETRERLKEQIRKQNYSHDLFKLSDSDHKISCGSFFAPYQPTVAPRVIQESKLFSVRTQIPALRAVSSDTIVSTLDKRMKVQRLRDTRDYSFLFSDDANLTLPIAAPTPAQAVSVPSTKQCAGSDNRRGLKQPNDAKLKPKQLAVASLKPLTNKHVALQHHCTEKRRPAVKAVHSAKQFAGSKGLQGPKDATVKPKQAVASMLKPAETKNKRVRDNISSPIPNSQDRPKKRRPAVISQLSDEEDDDEGEKARLIIRRMFNTERFVGRNDSDSKMETSFRDIMKEEKRSERLGRKEDEEQLRLLEEKARRHHRRTSAKRRNQGTKFVI